MGVHIYIYMYIYITNSLGDAFSQHRSIIVTDYISFMISGTWYRSEMARKQLDECKLTDLLVLVKKECLKVTFLSGIRIF